nr:hypothetical protein GCM10025699_41570 [Microbacterium flavescens]
MNAPVAWRDVTSAARLDLRRARDDAWSESTEAPVELAAGPWLVELRGDEVADIRFDGVTLLRGVRAVVRDHDWGTAATVSGAAAHDGDALRLDVRFTAPGIDLVGAVTLEATADSLTIALQATAAAPYRGNRAGLVVLHPPVLAGTALTVVHPDGSSTGTRFPLEIAPHQPARDVAALAWTAGGLALALDLHGEVFEMEDQRNWTDASFKTYSRPLDRPFPYEIPAGGAVRQSIALAVTRRGGSEPPRHPASTPIRLVATGAAFPGIGVGAGPASAAPLSPARAHRASPPCSSSSTRRRRAGATTSLEPPPRRGRHPSTCDSSPTTRPPWARRRPPSPGAPWRGSGSSRGRRT